jgi:hypothetical protein
VPGVSAIRVRKYSVRSTLHADAKMWGALSALFHHPTISTGGNRSCRPPFGLLPRFGVGYALVSTKDIPFQPRLAVVP